MGYSALDFVDATANQSRLPESDANTAALYQFNGDILDSGAGGLDLTQVIGTYTPAPGYVPGTVGAFVDGGANWYQGAVGALEIYGDVSIEFLMLRTSTSGAGQYIAVYSGDVASTAEVENVLWGAFVETSGYLRWGSQHSTGSTTWIDSGCKVRTNSWDHYLLTKDGTTQEVRLYINGGDVGGGTITQPTGGTNGRLRLGDGNTAGSDFFIGNLSGLKIHTVALDAEAAEAAARRALGR